MNTIGFVLLLGSMVSTQAAEPLRPLVDAVTRDFGVAVTQSTRLLKSELSPAAPEVCSLFASDPYRAGDLVKIKLDRVSRGNQIGWQAQSAGAGRLLQRIPPLPIDWALVQLGPLEVRRKAQQTAALAKASFTHIAFQLTTNAQTRRPQ